VSVPDSWVTDCSGQIGNSSEAILTRV
jgi:hypothetical protein